MAGQRNPGLTLELSMEEGREEKQHQSKRRRSLSVNESPRSVSSSGKPQGAAREGTRGRNLWEGN